MLQVFGYKDCVNPEERILKKLTLLHHIERKNWKPSRPTGGVCWTLYITLNVTSAN